MKNEKYFWISYFNEITDGLIDDLDNTIEELVESSFLPLSVIIIEIDTVYFSNMLDLDDDKNPVVNSKGVAVKRYLVQFVPFLKYANNPELSVNKVLAEILRQLIEYYEQNFCSSFNPYII